MEGNPGQVTTIRTRRLIALLLIVPFGIAAYHILKIQ
jgi:hypothetical protein